LSRGRRLLLAAVALLVLGPTGCSDDDGSGEAADPFAPVDGEPAPDGFAGDVVAATSAAGELRLEQELAVGDEVLASSTGVVDLGADQATTTVESAGGANLVRIEQRYADGSMTERRLDRPGAAAAPVAGWPLLLPDDDAVDDAADLAAAVRAALELTELHPVELDDAPAGTTCWAGVGPDPRSLRVEACTDDDLVLRLLRTTVQNPEGLVGTTSIALVPAT
jgi:hypothetical protein